MMGADFFESARGPGPERGPGHPADRDRTRAARSATRSSTRTPGSENGVRLINARGVQDEKGDIYCIVDGILVVPKNAVIPDGTVI